ncbi:MAG: glycoside hydrolase family 36 protein, partial [Bacteroidota bacterium]
LTLACSDSVNLVLLEAPVREEDNLIYASLSFFSEPLEPTHSYSCKILMDNRDIPFYQAIQGVSAWWNEMEELKAPSAPVAAFDAVYSTWYSYHQNLDHQQLLKECRASYEMGYRTIILDDGWQTEDSNRGYDYTGDWKAERLTELGGLVEEIHEMGMKVLIWYSVPFCGVKSAAYQRFKGKFLTENHRWAPVFDPRYPEVRKYLVDTYAQALQEWKLDGFKLDFIDDFKVYPETPEGKADGRDFASVYHATDQLLKEVYMRLTEIKEDVLIEYRQQFIGPSVQKYANMFRAFDCPNDAVTNRIRTTDVRLLNAEAAVHSDMITWHYTEEVEVAARQFSNILFSVPQISVRLDEIPAAHKEMLHFYTQFWLERRELFMFGDFSVKNPLANYSLQTARQGDHRVLVAYGDQVISWEADLTKIDVVNGGQKDELYCKFETEGISYQLNIYDCKGVCLQNEVIQAKKEIQALNVPVSGIATLEVLR